MRIALSFLLAICVFPISSYALKLSAAPEGFAWQEVLTNQAAFLLPAGWYHKAESHDHTDAFFFTKEEIVGSDGRFHTGLTVNLIRDIPEESGVTPSEYAARFIKTSIMQKEGTTLLVKKMPKQGIFQGFIQRLEIEPKEGVKVTVHRLLIANDTTGSLWMIFFEAPSSDWEEAWKQGHTMVDLVYIGNKL